MDVISFSEAATANSRIEIINANPDSNSGVLTQPKVIEAGETVTIKSGRQAILADTVVDGDLVIEAGGEVFVPAGAGFGDLDQRIDTLDDTTVKLTGNQTIADVKTFSSSPIVPTPTTTTQAANKAYVDSASGGAWTANDSRAKTALNASGTAPIYACRAWVNFNGTGTIAIRASGNVSSITDNGVGDYTVNFTTAMVNNNYCPVLGYGQSTASTNYKFAVKIDVSESGSTSLMTTTQLRLISSGDFSNLYISILN